MKPIISRLLWFVSLVLAGTIMAAVATTPQGAITAFARGDRTATPTATAPSGSTPTPTPTGTSPLMITTTSMPDGNVGATYSGFILSSGGKGSPDRFSIIAGSLPSGLTMDEFYGVQSTLVHGIPARLETTAFTVRVKDDSGTATKTLSITINPPLPLEITNQNSALAPGTVGTAYSANIFASGGMKPYTWAISAGQLPPGLSLNSNVISGMPATHGMFTFTVKVTDSGGQQASREFSITVS